MPAFHVCLMQQIQQPVHLYSTSRFYFWFCIYFRIYFLYCISTLICRPLNLLPISFRFDRQP